MKPWKFAAVICAVAALACVMLAGCQTQTYQPEPKEQAVSASALKQDGTLIVGVNANSAPLAGRPEGSTAIIGIDPDVAAYLADSLGLKLEIVNIEDDPESALSSGLCDIVLGVDGSATDVTYWRSSPYIVKGVALFGSENESAIPTPGDSSAPIAAQEGTWSEKRVIDLYGANALVRVDGLRTALENVSTGTVRYAAGDILAGSYLSDYPDYNINVKPLALMQDPSGYCVAVAQSNTELWTAIEAALDSLVDGGMMDVIQTKWLGAPIDVDGLSVLKTTVDTTAKPTEEAAPQQGEGEAPAEGEGGGEGEAPAEGEGGGEGEGY